MPCSLRRANHLCACKHRRSGSSNGVSEILAPENLRSRSFGVRSGSTRGPREVRSGSTRGPFGIRSGSARDPFGIRSGSVRGPREVRLGSVRDPFGVRSGFVRGPSGVRSGSVRDPFGVRAGSVRGPLGVRSGSVQAPFGPILDQNFRIQKFKISKIFNLCGRRRRGLGSLAAVPSPAARGAPTASATAAQIEKILLV